VKLVGIDLSHRDCEVCMIEDNTAMPTSHESPVDEHPGFARLLASASLAC
jgi:hypothetical protein